ncbi:hypothetical protein HZS_7255, partial [Henneguya salminicola]
MSGFLCAAATTPIDTIKTRIQNNKGEFKSITDVFVQMIKKEGPFSLMKGFTPFYLRVGPHTIITFIKKKTIQYIPNTTEKYGIS